MKIPKKNILEWSVFAVSLMLLIGLVVYIVRDAMNDQGRPPQIDIELGEPVTVGDRFRIPVRVTNSGDEAAEQVVIEVTLDDEASQLTIGLLPSHSEQKGDVFFSQDPRSGDVRYRVAGYLAP